MIAPSLHTRVSVFVCSSYVVVVVGLPPEELVSRGGGEVWVWIWYSLWQCEVRCFV